MGNIFKGIRAMKKKVASVLLVVIMLFSLGMTAFAAPTDDSAPAGSTKVEANVDSPEKDISKVRIDDILGSLTDETDSFIFTIKKPTINKDSVYKDSTYKKTYVISCVTDYEDVRIVIQKYNIDEKAYVTLKGADGEFQFDIGSFGVFAKEVKLEKGNNKFRLLAYRKAKSDELKAKDVQVSNLSITLMDESIKEKIVNSFLKAKNDVSEIINNYFSGNAK